MKLRILLITGILAFFGLTANAQCSASAMYYQSGTIVTFIDSSYSVNGHDVSWSFGDGTSGSGSWTSHTYAANGTYTACVYIYDTVATCADTFCFPVTVSSVGACNASFTSSVDSANPYKLNFTNTSNNAVSSYWWFGGSNSSTAYSPSHTFASAGYQTVCLTTYDSSGNLCDSICNSVYVPGSASSCAADGWFYITDSTVHFFDSSYAANGYFIEWSFGDGGTSTASNPSNMYATNQTYTACLYIEDSITGCNDTTCWSIFIPDSVSAPSYCDAYFYASVSGNTVSFYDSTTSSNIIAYSFGDGTTGNSSNPTHTYSNSGAYGVCLFVYDVNAAGDTSLCDSFCQTLNVFTCSSDFSYTIDSIYPTIVNFTNLSNNTGNSEWSSGPLFSNDVNPSIAFSSYGYHGVLLKSYDSLGNLCDQIYKTIYIPDTTGCDAYFTAHPDSLNMSASSFPVLFSNNSTGVNYIWNFGDGTTDTTANPTHIYTAAGTYTACLFVVSAYDSLSLPVICDSTCVTFTVGNPIVNCTPTMSYTVDSLNSNRYYFSGSNPPAGGYGVWSVYEASSTTTYNGQYATHTFGGTGSISVYYTLYRADSSYCNSMGDTFNLSGASCQASYYLGLDTNNLFNLYIINNSTGTTSATNYFWDFGDGSSSTLQYPTHQYASFGLYNLCLTITDSATGCSSTHCDSIGLDSNGNLLKKGAFGITVVDESDLLSTPKVETIQGVSVYPNPTVGRFTIKLNALQAEDLEITVMSSLGQVLSTSTQRVNAGGNALQMDLSNNPTGIYFVTMRAGNQVKNIRLNIISK